MVNDKELEYIAALAEEKSVSKAAARLFITQPALSLFLARVERQTGRPLFVRKPSGLKLTYAGECRLAMLRAMRRTEREFERKMCEQDANYAGHIKIGTSPHIGSYVLPEVVPALKRRFPNLRVSLTEGSSGLLEGLLAADELDIALLHLPLKNIEAECAHIMTERYVAAFAQGSLAEAARYSKDGEPRPFVHPEAFQGGDFVLAFPYQRVRQICDRILTHAGIENPRVVLITSSVQTALRCAEAGMGVTFLPESYLRLFPAREGTNLCYMEPEYKAEWSLVVVSPKGTDLLAPERAFIDLTRQLYRDCTTGGR